jgi:hypothetical protein
MPIVDFREFRDFLSDLNTEPALAKEIGRLVAAWSATEFYFLVLLANLLEAPIWRTQPAYYAISNTQTRLNMIRKLADEMQGLSEFKSRVVAGYRRH